MSEIGVVVIGRNEGERLKRCLRSLLEGSERHLIKRVVYVDSGSTDGSVHFAESLGVTVVNLDLTHPFTMPRARNAGFERLYQLEPALRWVQFVDGDCEVRNEWLKVALAYLKSDLDAAVVCGRRRERKPDFSIYNRLIDMEWNGPAGEVTACGGDALFRLDAFLDVAGFDGSMIAGEEPELCVRLRKAGWKIVRIDTEMTLHDANMTRFSQWYLRAVRAGHAYAEGLSKHGAAPYFHNLKPTLSAILYGGVLPAAGIVTLASLPFGRLALAKGLCLSGVTAPYAKAFWGAYRARRGLNDKSADAALYAAACLAQKVPELQGVLRFGKNRLLRRTSVLIEYKDQARAPA